MPEKIKNAGSDLPFTLIRHENGAFRKHSSDWRNSKTPALSFRVNAKHFERSFQKRWRHHSHVISLPESFSNTHSKWPVFVGFKNLSASVEWTKNISRALWAKTQFSNFPGVWNARIKRRWISRFSHLVLEKNIYNTVKRIPFQTWDLPGVLAQESSDKVFHFRSATSEGFRVKRPLATLHAFAYFLVFILIVFGFHRKRKRSTHAKKKD